MRTFIWLIGRLLDPIVEDGQLPAYFFVIGGEVLVERGLGPLLQPPDSNVDNKVCSLVAVQTNALVEQGKLRLDDPTPCRRSGAARPFYPAGFGHNTILVAV